MAAPNHLVPTCMLIAAVDNKQFTVAKVLELAATHKYLWIENKDRKKTVRRNNASNVSVSNGTGER